MSAKYFIRTARNGQYYFVLKARNGRTVLKSEEYKTLRGCKGGINSVQKNGNTNIIVTQIKNHGIKKHL